MDDSFLLRNCAKNNEKVNPNEIYENMGKFNGYTIYTRDGKLCCYQREQIAKDISEQINDYHNGGSNEEDKEI